MFAVHHPLAVVQRRQIGREGSPICQRSVLAEELECSGLVSGGELFQDQPAMSAILAGSENTTWKYGTGNSSASRSASHSLAAVPWHLGQCRLRQEL
jgi:hypothetical protein